MTTVSTSTHTHWHTTPTHSAEHALSFVRYGSWAKVFVFSARVYVAPFALIQEAAMPL